MFLNEKSFGLHPISDNEYVINSFPVTSTSFFSKSFILNFKFSKNESTFISNDFLLSFLYVLIKLSIYSKIIIGYFPSLSIL